MRWKKNTKLFWTRGQGKSESGERCNVRDTLVRKYQESLRGSNTYTDIYKRYDGLVVRASLREGRQFGNGRV